MAGDKYIRRQAVFNQFSDREKEIWDWIVKRTDNFSKQNFAAFVRDKLEWCMLNEGKEFKKAAPFEEQPSEGGWSGLID